MKAVVFRSRPLRCTRRQCGHRRHLRGGDWHNSGSNFVLRSADDLCMISHHDCFRKGNSMINKAILVGRLGKDPEVRYTPDGMMMTNFTLATDEQRKDKNGERVQKTEWHRIVTFGKLAEICGKYLVKGKLVFRGGAHPDQGLGRQGGGQTLHDRDHCLGYADARLERPAKRRCIAGRTAALPFRGGCASAPRMTFPFRGVQAFFSSSRLSSRRPA